MNDKQSRDEFQRAALHAVSAVQVAIDEHPIASIAATAGAGYVLAAGLPSWLVRAGAAIAMRTVAREVTSIALDTIAQNQAKSGPVPAHETAATPDIEPQVEPAHAPAK